MLDAHLHLGTLLRSSSSCLCLKKRPLHIILGHSNSVGLKIFCVVFCFFLLHCFYVISYLLTDTSVGYLLVNFSIFIHRCKTSRKSHLWISLSQSQPNLLSNNPSAFTKTAVEGNMFCFVAPCTCTCRMEGWNFVILPQRSYSAQVIVDGLFGLVTRFSTEVCPLQWAFRFAFYWYLYDCTL